MFNTFIRSAWEPSQPYRGAHLPDAANVVLAGFVVGQAVTERPFSIALALVGIEVWAGFMVFAMLPAPEDQP